LKKDNFFGSRLRQNSPNVFRSTIISQRLQRTGKAENGDLLLSSMVITEIQLLDAKGKSLFRGTCSGNSGESHTASQYAQDHAKSQRVYKNAVETAVLTFMGALALKTVE